MIALLATLNLAACDTAETPTSPSPLAVVTPTSISGIVHEGAPIADLPIPGARVEIVGGALDGRSTTTDALGRFSFEDVGSSDVLLRLVKTGYEEARHDIVRRGSLPPYPPEDIALVALPPIARLDVRIDGVGSTNAILGFSPIRFDATKSQAVRATYRIEFGDGESTTEQVAVHPCKQRGRLTGRLTIVDAFGRIATASTEQYPCIGIVHPQGPVYSLTYGWLQRPTGITGGSLRRIAFESQIGAAVSGFYNDHRALGRVHFTGTLHGDRSIRIVLDGHPIELNGEVLIRDTFGEHFYSVDRRLKLTVTGGPENGRHFDFHFYDPF